MVSQSLLKPQGWEPGPDGGDTVVHLGENEPSCSAQISSGSPPWQHRRMASVWTNGGTLNQHPRASRVTSLWGASGTGIILKAPRQLRTARVEKHCSYVQRAGLPPTCMGSFRVRRCDWVSLHPSPKAPYQGDWDCIFPATHMSLHPSTHIQSSAFARALVTSPFYSGTVFTCHRFYGMKSRLITKEKQAQCLKGLPSCHRREMKRGIWNC